MSAKHGVDWGRIAELFLLAVAAAGSVWAANEAKRAAEIGRYTTGNAALFQARLDGVQRFAEASGRIDTAMTDVAAATASADVDLEEREELKLITIDQLRRVAITTKPIIPAVTGFTAIANGSRSMWSDTLELQIADVRDAARDVTACYSDAASPPMTSQELTNKRAQLGKDCAHLSAKYERFTRIKTTVLHNMLMEARAALKLAGGDRLAPTTDLGGPAS